MIYYVEKILVIFLSRRYNYIMKRENLKNIEIWQQEYKFDYDCFDVSINHVENIRVHLANKGFDVRVLPLAKIFDNGNLYSKSKEDRDSNAELYTGIKAVNFPDNSLSLNYRNAYLGGRLTNHTNRESYRLEFKKYFDNLNSFLKNSFGVSNLPSSEEVDLELFMMAYAVKCDSYLSKERGFGNYLELIDKNDPTPNSTATIGRNNLNNPLFFDFVSSITWLTMRPEMRQGIQLKRNEKNSKWINLVSMIMNGVDVSYVKKAA